ncbi:hypothetical protein MYXO_03210 [Myxococcaceae bacterium]|nr:hypothetical protein MYXO_03210 [Myxococcaceae bacterium]
MPTVFFQIKLSVRPKSGGEAELVLPKVLQGLACQFLIVKEGGEEGIIQTDVSGTALKQVEKDPACKKLTAPQMETLKASYPLPKLKTKYRMQAQQPEGREGMFALNEAGDRIPDTFQTVRAGFYLIDVPLAQAAKGTQP